MRTVTLIIETTSFEIMLILTIEEEQAAKLQKVEVQSGLGAATLLNLVLVVLPMLRHCLGELA